MMVELYYYIIFGKGDASEAIHWWAKLTPEEEQAYKKAVENGEDLDEVPELQSVLEREAGNIEVEEIENARDMQDETVLEYLGEIPIDPDDLNDLVASGDESVLEALGLTEDDIVSFDANDMDEEDLPLIKDIDPDFEPSSPFESGWILSVHFKQDQEGTNG